MIDAESRPWYDLRPRLTREQRKAVFKEIESSSSPSWRFWVLTFLSTAIAAYGLLANSTAVVVGAMLVAPLMGPIFGLALATVTGHAVLMKRSLIAEVFGVALAIGVGWLIGSMPLNMGATPEMQARIAPTLYDLLIAIFSGMAGAYAGANSRVNAALPGVAISVALVPPLASCGLYLALGEYSASLGAFLLFTANFFAIQLASCGVYLLFNLGAEREVRRLGVGKFIVRFTPSLLGVALMAWFLTGTLTRIIEDRRLQTQLVRELSEQFAKRTGGRLQGAPEIREENGALVVTAVALTPRPFEPTHIEEIEDRLCQACDRDVRLIVRSIQSRDADRDGIVFHTAGERLASEIAEEGRAVLGSARDSLVESLSKFEGASLTDLYRTQSNASLEFTAVVATPVPIGPESVAAMEEGLNRRLDAKSRLIVRSVLTRDANSERFIYDPVPEKAPRLTESQIALQKRVTEVIGRRMAEIPGAVVGEVQFEERASVVWVRVRIEAPEVVGPEAVRRIEQDLRQFVDPRLRLQARTVVSATATASGWNLGEIPTPEP